MYYSHRSWIVAIAAGMALYVAGCQPKTAEKQAERKPAATHSTSKANEKTKPSPEPEAESKEAPEPESEQKATAAKPKPQELSPPPATLKVALSDKLRATCLVNVGDSMPQAELADLDGKLHPWDRLRDQKLTVVCFWTIGVSHQAQLRSDETLRDLAKEIALPFAEKGVSVVGINVGDSAEKVRQFVAETGAKFPCLLDPKGELYAKIATDRKMPRVFLLDAEGRILWFDVEFSRLVRREFVRSLHGMLGQ
jgi:peroxiredoxin